MGRPSVPPAPPQDLAQRQDTILLLDIPGKRFRMGREEQFYSYGEGRLLPLLKTAIFDGQSSYTDIPREANVRAGYVRGTSEPDISISKNDARYRPLTGIAAYWLSPLLMAHGLVPQLTAAPSFVDKLDSDDFAVQGQGVHTGRPCLILRTFPISSGTASCFDEYWVDLVRDSAIVRQSSYMNDKLRTDVDITYQQTSHGWLPLRWVGTVRDHHGRQLINVTRLRVEEFSINPAVTDADFQVEIKPGMILSVNEDAPPSERNPLGFQAPFIGWQPMAVGRRWEGRTIHRVIVLGGTGSPLSGSWPRSCLGTFCGGAGKPVA